MSFKLPNSWRSAKREETLEIISLVLFLGWVPALFLSALDPLGKWIVIIYGIIATTVGILNYLAKHEKVDKKCVSCPAGSPPIERTPQPVRARKNKKLSKAKIISTIMLAALFTGCFFIYAFLLVSEKYRYIAHVDPLPWMKMILAIMFVSGILLALIAIPCWISFIKKTVEQSCGGV